MARASTTVRTSSTITARINDLVSTCPCMLIYTSEKRASLEDGRAGEEVCILLRLCLGRGSPPGCTSPYRQIETVRTERSFFMKLSIKKILATAMAAAMVLSVSPAVANAADSKTTATEPTSQTNAEAEKSNAKGVETVAANTSASGKATVTEITVSNKKAVTVPSKVTVNGVVYTVTKLGANAFKGETVKKVTLPSSITSLGSKAFTGVKGLKTVKISTTKKVSVNKAAFKGVNTKGITITVSKKMSKKNLKALKASLKKAGFKGKVKVA